jgi:pumilio family protein 6
MRDFVLKHDAVRAVQTAIKYATAAQRKMVAKELQGTFAQLAESRYAKFLIGKLLAHEDSEIRDLVIPEFYGRVNRLINHPEASWILDDIYRGAANEQQKAMLLREWYSPEFAIMEKDSGSQATGDLGKILEREPAKRGPIMKHLRDMINRLVQKKMTGFTMLHDAMFQYYRNVGLETQECSEFLEMIKGDEGGDLLKNMAFTRFGSHLVCLLLANGNAKDRRQILKVYKDTFTMMSGDKLGHIVILVAYDVIDDTKMSSKAIFPELLGDSTETAGETLIAASSNPFARATILYLLDGPSKAVFQGAHLQEDLEMLKEVHEIREKTSKKDADLRTKELAQAMSPQLLAGVTEAAATLSHDPFGCQLSTDILVSCEGDKAAALAAIAATAAGSPSTEMQVDGSLEPQMHISKTPHGGKMLKILVQNGKFDRALDSVKKVDPPLKFSNVLYPIIKDYLVEWATGPSSFVVLSMLEADDFDDVAEMKKILRKNREVLEKAAGEGGGQPAAKAASKAASKAGKGKKKDGNSTKSSGNAGSRLILQAL